MMKKGEHVKGVPEELQLLLQKDKEANAFFETLARSHKQAYCDWVGSAKRNKTYSRRQSIVDAPKQTKTLKTV